MKGDGRELGVNEMKTWNAGETWRTWRRRGSQICVELSLFFTKHDRDRFCIDICRGDFWRAGTQRNISSMTGVNWNLSLQILELVSYIVRNRPEDERNSFVGPFQNALKSGEGKKPIEEDESRRKLIISKVLADVKGLGEGSDKGGVYFVNLSRYKC